MLLFIPFMPWHEKNTIIPFDAEPPQGLYYLDGDLLAKRFNQDRTQGQKYSLITYPSGLQRELSLGPDNGSIVNIFGALSLPRKTNRDEGFETALEFGSQFGYTVAKRGENGLMVFNPYTAHGYAISYDNRARTIADIKRFPREAMDLLDGESRAILPKLYANEYLGLDAISPVKFFTPDGNWTWYPSEYDGEDTFFGLVSGFEVELGYFSLTEIEGIRGHLGLPVERDLYFTPKSLRQLQAEQER